MAAVDTDTLTDRDEIAEALHYNVESARRMIGSPAWYERAHHKIDVLLTQWEAADVTTCTPRSTH